MTRLGDIVRQAGAQIAEALDRGPGMKTLDKIEIVIHTRAGLPDQIQVHTTGEDKDGPLSRPLRLRFRPIHG